MALTPRQMRAVGALFNHPTLEAVAAEIGVTTRTLARWKRDPEFAQALFDAGREVMAHGSARLKDGSCRAVEILRNIMEDSGYPAGARVNAAKAVIELAHRAVEVEDLAHSVSELRGEWEAFKTAGGK